MKWRIPRGLLGATFGALASLPLLPIASGLAIRFSSLPSLPGAERRLGDFKQATYAEAAVFVLLLPLAALFFGRLLPDVLERRAATGHLSFEWVGVAFSLSFFLAQRGVRPKHALLAGLAAAGAAGMGIFIFRASVRLRRIFVRRNRGYLLRLAVAGAVLALARRAGLAPRTFLPDLLAELVLAALVITSAALILSFLFFRRPAEPLRRLAAATPYAIALSSAAILFPRAAPELVAAGLAILLIGVVAPGTEPPSRRALPASLLVLLVCCGWRILRTPVSPLSLFEEGHILAYAQSYLHGARPYLDTYPVHGWGSDGAMDAFVFRLFEPTVSVFQLRHAVWSVAALACLATTCFAGLGFSLFGGLALFFCLGISPLPFDRQTFAFAALSFLLLGVRKKRRGFLFVAGMIAGWSLLYSLDFGMIILLGGFFGLVLLSPLESGWRKFRPGLQEGGRFLAGALAGALPFLILLAARGSLWAFFRVSFLEIPTWAVEAWGLPAGRAWDVLLRVRDLSLLARLLAGEGMSSLFFLCLLAVSAAILLLRSLGRRIGPEDRIGWMVLVVAVFALRGALGRADETHLQRYGVFAGILAAWLLLRATRAGPLPLVAAAGLVLLRFHPLRTFETQLSWVEAAGRRDEASVGATAPRSGGPVLPPGQAQELAAFRRYIDQRLAPGETFFDFASQPGLYFVADRLLPIRFHTVALYESQERQKEVLADLESRKPPIALLPSTLDAGFDNVPNQERAPWVAQYLEENYEFDRLVGVWTLAKRRQLRPQTTTEEENLGSARE